MDGFRCTECGHATWSLFSTMTAKTPAVAPSCPLCGGEVRAERRIPGRNRRHAATTARVDRRVSTDRRTLGPVPR